MNLHPVDHHWCHNKHCNNLVLTVWLVIFAGTNFRETGQNSGFRNFRGFNFRGR